jgi:hypothetical protein
VIFRSCFRPGAASSRCSRAAKPMRRDSVSI